MRKRKQATGAELSAATGLSLVTVYKELARLIQNGEAREQAENAPARGGRPARLYACEAGYARRALLIGHREGATLRITREVADLHGKRLSLETGSWARLEAGSVEGWLEGGLQGGRVASIALAFEEKEEAESLRGHLKRRYDCPVASLCPAEALADGRENTATLYLRRGGTPRCSLLRHGRAETAGALDMLPLPAAWDTLDYTDHTLVEEMVARLLQTIGCVLTPGRMTLHADFWSTRLTERIRFNTQSKLKRLAPELQFCHTSPEAAEEAMRRRAWTLGL